MIILKNLKFIKEFSPARLTITILLSLALQSGISFSQDITINFDLSKPAGVASGQGSGFLHSMRGRAPPDQFVDPLKIKFWRGACLLDEDLYRRLKRTDTVIQYVLSDGFQHPTQGTCAEQQDLKDRWPHLNPALWQQHVEREARRIKANGWNVIWEPWNEPDYWEKSDPEHLTQAEYQQYLDAFLVAYQSIRKVDPNAQFAGPGLSANSWPTARMQLEIFLNFCADNNLEVTNLAWHGFDDSKNTHKWPERIKELRDLAVKKYPAVKVQRIAISEIVPEKFFQSPGDLIMALKYLDDAGADFVGRSCWDKSCWSEDLDGSVIKGEDDVFQPTSRWWANYWYASTTGTRYSGVSSNPGVAATAVMRKDQPEVTVLVGFSKAMGPAKARNIILNFNYIRENMGIRVERLPGNVQGILKAASNINRFKVTSNAQGTKILLPMVHPGDVYQVSLKVPHDIGE